MFLALRVPGKAWLEAHFPSSKLAYLINYLKHQYESMWITLHLGVEGKRCGAETATPTLRLTSTDRYFCSDNGEQ